LRGSGVNPTAPQGMAVSHRRGKKGTLRSPDREVNSGRRAKKIQFPRGGGQKRKSSGSERTTLNPKDYFLPKVRSQRGKQKGGRGSRTVYKNKGPVSVKPSSVEPLKKTQKKQCRN